jgi:transcription elongation factor
MCCKIARTSLLVDLDGGLVVVDSNDFSDEVVMTNADLKRSTDAVASSVYRIQVRT